MKKKIIVIVGPTSSNKSSLAFKLKDNLDSVIINADSFQVYQEIQIGTHKLDKATIKKYQIKLMDHVSIFDNWNIKRFQEEAIILIEKALKEQKVPIIVGGSNLYIDCLINGYNLQNSKERNTDFANLTNDELFAKLKIIDEKEADKMGSMNRRRLIRALQLNKELGLKKSHIITNNKPIYKALLLECFRERDELYEWINHDVIAMIAQGWVKEVKDLIDTQPQALATNAFQAIGYKEISNSIMENSEIDVSAIQQRTRNFAKRQITWIKNKFITVRYDQKNFDHILSEVKRFINE